MPAAGGGAGASNSSSNSKANAAVTKGEFTRKAAAIGKDISDTTVKLGRLAECEFDMVLDGCASITKHFVITSMVLLGSV